MSSAYSVQYPNGKHPMGSNVSHHHSHENNHPLTAHHDSDNISAFNATESIIDIVERDSGLSADSGEHDHSNHSHTPSHLPIESHFNSDFYQAGTLSDADVLFSNHRYAPPNPPPHS
ncbi:hypothetical protein [Shewanella sp. KX20019]|uniref:hypothetical protein n=1 Tax=Shewanella sp. KX20019 TaxID=2803864 RepID=UPI001F282DED|nr:hypothetical protein [Shewanella sp. KX20019]